QIIKKKPSTLKRKRAQSSQSKYDTSNMPLIGVPNNSDNSDNDIEDE
ncbi:18031_t:CDS:2, partial [Rhizophagus irregularis]